MTIQERSVGPAIVLALEGRLVFGEDEPLKLRVRDLFAAGATHLMLDMAGVTYVDSSGLGVLVSASLAARQHNGSVTLVAPSSRLVDLLAVARLQGIVRVCASEAVAFQDLSPLA